MNVLFERGGLPAPHFLDVLDWCTIKEEGHGSASSQGVTADIGWFVAKLVEANCSRCMSDGVIDVLGLNVVRRAIHGVVNTVDWGIRRATMVQDVVDATGQ